MVALCPIVCSGTSGSISCMLQIYYQYSPLPLLLPAVDTYAPLGRGAVAVMLWLELGCTLVVFQRDFIEATQ
jgi:hypothetical protein